MNAEDLLRALVQREQTTRNELADTRRAWLVASRKGDYRRVAQLSLKTARLNEELATSQFQQEVVY